MLKVKENKTHGSNRWSGTGEEKTDEQEHMPDEITQQFKFWQRYKEMKNVKDEKWSGNSLIHIYPVKFPEGENR